MKPRHLLLLALAAVLTGCVNLGVGQRGELPGVVYYVLDDATPASSPAPVPAGAPVLLVLDTATGGFYDSDQIVFSRSPGTRGQYQFARWTERPGKRFAELMRARLDRQGVWNVSAAGGYVRGDVLLDTELVEFFHDASDSPGRMRLVLRAELVDLRQRTLLGRRVFEHEVALASYDAAGAAQAANRAVRRALDDLTTWVATATPK
ncbi:MAG: ABC-type transport auxiliary lipoprotein family protein [Thiobacillus sp.]